MKLAIVGSRNIKEINIDRYVDFHPECVISGGAKGVDSIAEKWANEKGIKTVIFRPDYARFGKGAPLKRNHTIIENADTVIAFWDGKSKGTKYTIDLARRMGKTVKVISWGATQTRM
jgi:predicted Rossmann fold nucleotide-binding protein DprA/Smf involved in DNA uptake